MQGVRKINRLQVRKICTKGCACGNAYFPAPKPAKKGPGCACNG
jgi:hypothetical protein